MALSGQQARRRARDLAGILRDWDLLGLGRRRGQHQDQAGQKISKKCLGRSLQLLLGQLSLTPKRRFGSSRSSWRLRPSPVFCLLAGRLGEGTGPGVGQPLSGTPGILPFAIVMQHQHHQPQPAAGPREGDQDQSRESPHENKPRNLPEKVSPYHGSPSIFWNWRAPRKGAPAVSSQESLFLLRC
jgi:hypothetical protein